MSETVPTAAPPILRALRVLGLGRAMLPIILDDVDADRAARLFAGAERLRVDDAMFLVLFAAAWSAKVYGIAAARPGVVAQIERNLVAALELQQAQQRVNVHTATDANYRAALARWAEFEARGEAAWDDFFNRAMIVSPVTGERVDVLISPDEVRH